MEELLLPNKIISTILSTSLYTKDFTTFKTLANGLFLSNKITARFYTA